MALRTSLPAEDSIIGVFEFVVLLVLISTIGKIILGRQEQPRRIEGSVRPEELMRLDESMSELSARLQKLEEERDFYRALLEPSDSQPGLPPGRSGNASTDEEREG